jgi:hypothetical protein
MLCSEEADGHWENGRRIEASKNNPGVVVADIQDVI